MTKQKQIIAITGGIAFLLIVISLVISSTKRFSQIPRAEISKKTLCDLNKNNFCFDENDLTLLQDSIEHYVNIKCDGSKNRNNDPNLSPICKDLVLNFDVDENGFLDYSDIFACQAACAGSTANTVTQAPFPTATQSQSCNEGIKQVVVDRDSCRNSESRGENIPPVVPPSDGGAPQDSDRLPDDRLSNVNPGTSTTHVGGSNSTFPDDRVRTDINPTPSLMPDPSLDRVKLLGFLCWNDNENGVYEQDEFLPYTTDCITQAELKYLLMGSSEGGTQEKGLYQQIQEGFCKGKRPASCFSTVLPTPTVSFCQEGIKIYNVKVQVCGGDKPVPPADENTETGRDSSTDVGRNTGATNTAGGGSNTTHIVPTNTPFPTPRPDMQFVGNYICWDNEVVNVDTGCVRGEDADLVGKNIYLEAMRYCAGRKSPDCDNAGKPTPTFFPNITPTGIKPRGECGLKAFGDANCDNVIDLVDFAIFLEEFVGTKVSKTADFTGDGVVSLADFEVFRNTYTSINSD